MSGTVYVVGNFKGGVGKTKTVTMLAYESARYLKERTLVIDMDPQGNATRVLAKTGNLDAIDKSITEGFQNGALETEVITVMENLDIIPANTSFRNLPKMLFNMFPDDEVAQITYLKKLVAPLKEKYDRLDRATEKEQDPGNAITTSRIYLLIPRILEMIWSLV